MAANRALSRTSDVARSVRRLPHPRNPRFLLCFVTRRAFSSARRAAAQPSAFAVGCAGPQTTQKDAELGGTGLRLGLHRLPSPGGGSRVSFLSPPWNRGTSRFIGTDGLQQLRDAATPNPLRKRRGLEFWGRGTRGWRPGGLTPGDCLKPFQGVEVGVGKGRGRPELMTGVASSGEVWRRDVSNPEVIDAAGRGWDVSSQKELWVARGWAGVATRRRLPNF